MQLSMLTIFSSRPPVLCSSSDRTTMATGTVRPEVARTARTVT